MNTNLIQTCLLAALLSLPGFGAQGGVVFTELHAFQVSPDGAQPAGLVQGNDGNFYGTTESGGTNAAGTIFKISTNGALTTLYSFINNDGLAPDPQSLVQGNDGNFYGTTALGGTNNSGSVFKITAIGALTNLYLFTGGGDGLTPSGLVQGGDGNFYGTTAGGGTFASGTIFKISTSGTLTTLYSFGSVQDTNGLPLDGANPEAALVQGNDGYFYGTTSGGGTFAYGTVFKISAAGILTSLYSFTGGNDGARPAWLVQGSDGNFYGTAAIGRLCTVFKISANGALTTLVPSIAPPSKLVQGNDGYLYGTTPWNFYDGFLGYVGAGTVFKISTNGVLTTLYSFTGGNDGAQPDGLVQGGDGNFYGTTASGGTNNLGTVFQIGTNGVLTSLYSFIRINDGSAPYASLVQGNDGNFYGTTSEGGTYDEGTVFRIGGDGLLTNLHSFSGFSTPSGNDGAYPYAGLVQGSDGNFYGVTSVSVFQMTPAGALTTLGGPAGPGSLSSLVQGSDGYFYGTIFEGGTDNVGAAFKINTNGVPTTLHSFTGGNDGAYPQGGLVQGSDGYFYGTTEEGGFNWNGTVFRMSTNGALTTLHLFTGGNDGAGPQGGLVQGSDGYFYGTTSSTVFKINANGTLTTLHTFSGGDYDASPAAGLVRGSDGYFYGTTYFGGTDNLGTVFRISTNGALTSLYSFTGDGANPHAPLVQGNDGNFYGTTSDGGAGGAGIVFRLTIVPEFQAVTLSNGTLNLSWSTEAGGKYQLEYNTDLSSSNWINLGSASTATGATLSVTDSVTNGPQRFYRLVLPP